MTLAQARTKILAASTANADMVAAIAQHLITVDGAGNISVGGVALSSGDEIQFAQALPGLPQ